LRFKGANICKNPGQLSSKKLLLIESALKKAVIGKQGRFIFIPDLRAFTAASSKARKRLQILCD